MLSSTKILFFFVRKRRAFGVSTLGFHFFLFFSPPFFLKIFKEKGPHHTKKDFFSLRKFRGIQHKNRSLRGVRESPRTKSNTHSLSWRSKGRKSATREVCGTSRRHRVRFFCFMRRAAFLFFFLVSFPSRGSDFGFENIPSF